MKDLTRGHAATEQRSVCAHMHMHAYDPYVHVPVSHACGGSGPGTPKPIIKRVNDSQLHTHITLLTATMSTIV